MPVFARRLAYYVEHHTDAEYWDSVWDTSTMDGLLASARISPLTAFLERHIGPCDRTLEAGCGLGQYVRHFSEHGVQITGVDYAEAAIGRHLQLFPESDVRVGDVENLPFPDDSFDVCISLGLVEHYEHDPSPLLAEARRVLAPGGRLLLSVPYLNASRAVLAPRFRAHMEAIRRDGGEFYQWAFSRRALDGILRRAGFTVTDRGLYDVGKGVRLVGGLFGRASPAAPAAPEPVPPPSSLPLRRAVAHNALALRTFAHMQIVCAVPQA
jgi:SAM-dependent methyltransferase